ncbi:hypothetical protein, conserved [Babesia bigemina]|uniref:Uncharacterized protein n=1 Tax=Babesia bigemina TaxID=5866 RepID=A0A061D8P4_BABBI|nr:hypothetical protein, conserved [Babesia bigemina]CDR96312.1 hypothetical protein, conserved [Babesia bigemina]|eukprot:XP_012768498.1 hypothetical protein, conserved [Babesia bigemina]
MKSASHILQVLAGRGSGSRSSTCASAVCDPSLHQQRFSCRDIEYLLELTPVSALLHSHAKVLVVESALPLYACLKAMSEYEQEFALVYDSCSLEFLGYFDELMFLHLLLSGDFSCISCSGGEYLRNHGKHTFCKVEEDCSARDALPCMLNQSPQRLCVWSHKRAAPMGFVTARCYLGYITKHLRGCRERGGRKLEDVLSSEECTPVTEDSSLREISEILLCQDETTVLGSDGCVIGILNRGMIVRYVLALLRNKVKDSSSLLEALPELLASKNGAILSIDCPSGGHRVLTVWDVLRHMLYQLYKNAMITALYICFLRLFCVVLCSGVRDVKVEEHEGRGKSAVVRGGVTIPLLTIARDEGEGSLIQFEGNSSYTLGVDSLGNFAISAGDQPMLVISNEQNISFHMDNLSVRSVDFGGDLVVEGVSQFKMIWRESFVDARGWNGTVSSCAGIPMLGGFKLFGRGWVQKTFIELPVHRELRIKASFHFLDQWAGESGYMKLNTSSSAPLEYVWTDIHAEHSTTGINICGGETPDSKFAVPIEVTIPHSSERFTIEFGSTLEGDAVQQSWGVSGLEIYVR